MSASARARLSRKCSLRISIERGCYRSRTSTSMFGAQKTRLLRQRCRTDVPQSSNYGVITSILDVSEPIDISSEADTHTFVEDVSKVINITLSRIDMMQDHWHETNERMGKVSHNIMPTDPTLGNTTTDCTFTENTIVDVMPYVSYFSDHRPILNKIVVEYEAK